MRCFACCNRTGRCRCSEDGSPPSVGQVGECPNPKTADSPRLGLLLGAAGTIDRERSARGRPSDGSSLMAKRAQHYGEGVQFGESTKKTAQIAAIGTARDRGWPAQAASVIRRDDRHRWGVTRRSGRLKCTPRDPQGLPGLSVGE